MKKLRLSFVHVLDHQRVMSILREKVKFNRSNESFCNNLNLLKFSYMIIRYLQRENLII